MNGHVAAEMYPIRPILREGESLGGWCWRIYPANGHELPAAARSALLAIRATRVLQPDNALSQLIGFERLKPLHDRENSIIDPWSEHLSPEWYAWSKRPRFCVQCMAESECHFVYWDLPLVSACAVHGCHLTTRCHSCRNMWSWPTLRHGWRCRCSAKIAEGLAREALPLNVRFSRVLCAASDALVPTAVKLASAGSAPVRAAYRTRDVYETLGWLLKVRRVLTNTAHHAIQKAWPMVAGPNARMAPSSWEKTLMMGFPHTIDRKARQTLRWFFKGSSSTLVDLRSVDRWRDVEKLMDELSAERNPFAGSIFRAIERAQLEHHAGIPGQETMLFNPRLNQARLDKRLAELTAWLRLLSGDESANGSKERPVVHQILGGQVSALSSHQTEVVVALLNVMFDAAHQGIPSIKLGQSARTEGKGAGYAS